MNPGRLSDSATPAARPAQVSVYFSNARGKKSSKEHANATLHDSLGTPLGTVQALLGHSSSEITRQVYLHSMMADRRRAVNRLEAALFGPKSDPNPQPMTEGTIASA